jgi:hypothetical protein
MSLHGGVERSGLAGWARHAPDVVGPAQGWSDVARTIDGPGFEEPREQWTAGDCGSSGVGSPPVEVHLLNEEAGTASRGEPDQP